MGVVFFIINAAFALILLLLVLFATGFAIFSKNPDTRYQPMRDDRGSFIKSQSQLNTELDALGVTARGDMAQKGYYGRDIDDDESFSSGSGKHTHDAAGVAVPSSTSTPAHGTSLRDPPHSPIDPNMPYYPSDGQPRHGAPMYNNSNDSSRPGADMPLMGGNRAPSFRSAQSQNSSGGFRNQNSSPSPWQRGAGYDH